MANRAKQSNILNKRIHEVSWKLYRKQFSDEREKQKANPDSYSPPERFFSFYEILDALNAKYSKKAVLKASRASEVVRTNNDRRQKHPKKRKGFFSRLRRTQKKG